MITTARIEHKMNCLFTAFSSTVILLFFCCKYFVCDVLQQKIDLNSNLYFKFMFRRKKYKHKRKAIATAMRVQSETNHQTYENAFET